MFYSIPLYSIYFMFGVVVIALDTHLYDSITEPNSLKSILVLGTSLKIAYSYLVVYA